MRGRKEREYGGEVDVAEEQVEREESSGDHKLPTKVIINC